ncbi:FliA/WhiG family RNA polymerase sigma factor [Pseudalkalibacillus caeni]|uniref:FliA/WhiG family RNA polymerase sigma factor n=2 Tax=Exobacillus caeni TaxID=2574798 RepID=A0A5R9F7D0_9BACL|nr:FliA/WhiG family RNA polymerase sigma factor [Pseudalkalibacillus caeni]TLS36733.1 FliA/WhiG family RNA polymerase sigma factor [Pseudalkalibacillus caeni]
MDKQTIEYWQKWKEEKDAEAGDYLAKLYLPLVETLVQKYSAGLPVTVRKDDLLGFATDGLLDAIEKFDLERDLKFETYASWRIKGAIIDGLRKNDWVPRSVRDKVRKIEEAYAVLEQDKLTSVTDEEVAEYLGISIKEMNQAMQDASLSIMVSVDEPVYEDDEHKTGRFNLIENENAETPDRHIHQQFIQEILQKTIERLPEKEKLIVSLVYFEELKLTEIAEILGLSTSRISQLHSRAMMRMKGALSNHKELVQNM